MRLTRTHYLILLFLSFFSFSTLSAAADIEKGKKKAAFCQHCHGTNGNSKSPQYPSLAGQRATYLEDQLKKYKSGQRSNSVMKNLVKNLSEEDISNISAYFSSLPSKSAGGNELLAQQGKNKIAMCTGCHGQSAQGRASIPKLAGQQPDYLEQQLLNFKNRSRKGGAMNSIASALTEQDIKEISAYLSTL